MAFLLGEAERQVEVADKVSIAVPPHTRNQPSPLSSPTYANSHTLLRLFPHQAVSLARWVVARCARPHTSLIVLTGSLVKEEQLPLCSSLSEGREGASFSPLVALDATTRPVKRAFALPTGSINADSYEGAPLSLAGG